jgi:uncharacterized protein (DUF1501 family)
MNPTERLTRRQFLACAGVAAAGFGALPGWVRRASAAARGRSKRTLVVLFQRGAADGLNIVPPFLDPIYRRSRPSIAIDDPTKGGSGAIDLDGRFGLHPALESLLPMWKDGRFALVQAAGSPDPTRSHFDAQDYMEIGTPGVKTTEDGWLNRALAGGKPSPVEAAAISPRLPRILQGPRPALSLTRADSLASAGGIVDSFESIYDDTIDAALSGAAHDLGEARRALANLPKTGEADLQAAGYPRSLAARDLFELSRLLKADVGLRVGFVQMGGWDHHFKEGSSDGLLARRLEELGTAVAAFYRDLGDRSEDVLLLTMTEFGRTIEENGNGGTDHGHASVMMLFGGEVRGGKVYGRWPGLEKENLFEGRDLQVTTDFRQVAGEALTKHLGLRSLGEVFPGGRFPPIGFLS